MMYKEGLYYRGGYGGGMMERKNSVEGVSLPSGSQIQQLARSAVPVGLLWGKVGLRWLLLWG